MVRCNGMAHIESTNTPERASLIQLKVMSGNKEATVPEGRVHICTAAFCSGVPTQEGHGPVGAGLKETERTLRVLKLFSYGHRLRTGVVQ